jgi:hypothetical protein
MIKLLSLDASGNYWSGNGSKLYKRSPGDSRWALIADFKTFGISQISRLAINLNSGQIDLVSNRAITK